VHQQLLHCLLISANPCREGNGIPAVAMLQGRPGDLRSWQVLLHATQHPSCTCEHRRSTLL